MFRRRPSAPEVPITMLTESEHELVGDWWQSAAERIDAGPRETTWLSATLMVQMTLGYAENSDSRVPPLAYAFATRSGYALRMFVDRLAAPRPLDVSGIEPDSIATLATFPVDAEIGTADIPDDVSDRLVLPIVMLVSDTANQPDRFTEIVSRRATDLERRRRGRDASAAVRVDCQQRHSTTARPQPRRRGELSPLRLCAPQC